ncbi:reverse transcriptase domain-containing protein, partial [Tanacetum coccineum]
MKGMVDSQLPEEKVAKEGHEGQSNGAGRKRKHHGKDVKESDQTRIYVDGGSSVEVMYEHCFRNLGTKTRARLRESRTPLVGFFREVNYPMGVINLNVTMGEIRKLRTVTMEFTVVKSHSPYNVILGRTDLRSLGAVASTIHLMRKFPTNNGIATMTTKRQTLQECQMMEEVQGPITERRVTDKCADKSKITRIQSKSSKHGHENQKSSKRSQRFKAEAS